MKYDNVIELIENGFLKPFLIAYPSLGELFWQLTPKSIKPYMEAYASQREMFYNDIDTLAWKVGYYIMLANKVPSPIVIPDSKAIAEMKRESPYPEKPDWVRRQEREACMVEVHYEQPKTEEERKMYENFVNGIRAKAKT